MAGRPYAEVMAERPARPILVLHPFLVAILPVAFLFGYNVRRLYVSPAELVLPLAIPLGLTFLVWFGLRFAFHSGAKAGLLVTLTLVLLLIWDHVAGALSAWFAWYHNWQLGVLFAVILAAGCWLVARTRRVFDKTTMILNLATGLMLALNVVPTLPMLLQSGSAGSRGPVVGHDPNRELPDIYYIVPDGHARSDILREVYDYDDSPFVAGLRARGFYVADRARSNYCQTYLSLASALNMTYVDSLAKMLGPESGDRRPLEHWLLHNRVMRELRASGYRLVSFASGFSGTDFRDVDVRFSSWRIPGEFQILAASLAPGRGLLRLLTGKSLHDLHRDRIEYILNKLPTAAQGRSPTFTFAHIVCPHPPFVFGPSGEKLELTSSFFTLGDGSDFHEGKPGLMAEYVELYAGQVHYIDECLLRVIDDILANSERPPLIVLHADHGPRSQTTRDDPHWTSFPEGLSILYAVLMPGRDYTGWYDSITPVNTFRLVFDRLFDDTLSILPDRSFFATWARPYEYYDVDEWHETPDTAR
jgi:hypothetical protein